MLRFSLEKEKIDLKEKFCIGSTPEKILFPLRWMHVPKELLSRPDPQTHQALYLLEEGAALEEIQRVKQLWPLSGMKDYIVLQIWL